MAAVLELEGLFHCSPRSHQSLEYFGCLRKVGVVRKRAVAVVGDVGVGVVVDDDVDDDVADAV